MTAVASRKSGVLEADDEEEEEELFGVYGHQTSTLIETSASPAVVARDGPRMDPEPERSLAKRESRREAKDEEGSDGSKAAMLFFMSEAATDSALELCVFDVDGTLGTGDKTGYVDDGDKDDEDGGVGER